MDNLDRELMETKTGETPAEKVRRLFGKEGITNNYAKHMLTGIRLYINERNKSNQIIIATKKPLPSRLMVQENIPVIFS